MIKGVIIIACLWASSLCADPFALHEWVDLMFDDPVDGEPGNVSSPDGSPSDWPEYPNAPRGPSGENIETAPDTGAEAAGLSMAVDNFNRNLATGSVPATGRAPYPYFHSWSEINSSERAISRPAFFDADFGYWLNDDGEARSNRGRIRSVLGVGSWEMDYTHVGTNSGRESADWLKGYLGFSWPLYSGYFNISAGGSWLDDHEDFNNFSFNLKSDLSWYPMYPLGLVASFDTGFFDNGRYVIDWEVEAKLQVWRPVFVTLGWREVTTLGHSDSFNTDGFYFGFSLTFSNVRTMFDAPQGGPANGIFGLLE